MWWRKQMISRVKRGGARSGGSWAQRLVSPGSWNALVSGHMDVLSKAGSVPSSNFRDFYGGFIEEAPSLIESPLSNPFRGRRWGGLKVPSFSLWLALSVISPHHAALQEPSRSCLIMTEDSCHPGNSEGFRSSVLGTGVKVQIREGKVLQVALSSKRLQGFQGFCVRNRVQRPVIYFLWFHTILWNTISLHSIWRNWLL